MMAIRDIQYGTQIRNWLEHLIRIIGMHTHEFPFLLREFIWLEEDTVWHAEFANIMEKGTASYVDQFLITEAIILASLTVISVTRCVCPSVSVSR